VTRMKTQSVRKKCGWSRGTVPPAPLKLIEKPTKGVTLKTVSAFTLTFALVCLAALIAGRPPVSADGREQTAAKERPMFLGLRTGIYHVEDLARAKEWYTKVLGVQPYFDQAFYVGFNVGGYELGLVPDEASGDKRQPSSVAYWGVDDAKAAYQRLLELGATSQEPVTDVGGGIIVAAVYDPFGNVLGVIQNPYFKLPDSN
jgi:predicted enzyme related to lactoylglutathione lyase